MGSEPAPHPPAAVLKTNLNIKAYRAAASSHVHSSPDRLQYAQDCHRLGKIITKPEGTALATEKALWNCNISKRQMELQSDLVGP